MLNTERLALLTALLGVALLSAPRWAAADDGPAGSPADVAAATEGVAAEKVPAPAGQATKFLLPYYRSVEGTSGTTPNSTSSIQISNLNNAICDVSVQWLVQDAVLCERTEEIVPYATQIFCTRDLDEEFESCIVVCNPELDYRQGRAQINISKAAACKKFAVAARLIQTNSDDTALIAMQDLKIIKPTGNAGD
jgi:hypothetical protein